MHYSTTVSVGEAKGGAVDANKTRKWGTMAKMVMLMIVSALIGRHAVEAVGDDMGVEDSLGADDKFTGVAFPYHQDDSFSHRKKCSRWVDLSSWAKHDVV